MTERKPFDTTILLLAVTLACLGVVMVYSSSSIMAVNKYGDGFHFLKRQGVYALAGFSAMALFMWLDYRRCRALVAPFLLLSMVLMAAALIPGVGVNANGATRWVRMPGFAIQPSELAKISLVIYLAASLVRKKEKIKTFKLGLFPYLVMLAPLLLLLGLQRDLGSALIMVAVSFGMLIMAGLPLRWPLLGAALMAPILYWQVAGSAYRLARIQAYLDPFSDPMGKGFQIIQSWTAFGYGGLFGQGLGEGKQKLFYLPEAHTDFIFSVLGEELGFSGVFIVSSMFLLLVLGGFRIAMRCTDPFGRNLAFGISLLLGIEAFGNMMVTTGILPTKGLALPFLSYGGSSLIASLLAVGILLSVSAHGRMEES